MFLRLLQRRPILLPHSGLVTASYGHVDDLCDAMLAMVGDARAVGEVFNITAEAVTTRRSACRAPPTAICSPSATTPRCAPPRRVACWVCHPGTTCAVATSRPTRGFAPGVGTPSTARSPIRMIGRMTDAAVAAAVAPTLRAVHADQAGDWARTVVAQLIAIVEHAEQRPPDTTGARRAALAAALAALAANPLVPTGGGLEERASVALAGAIGRHDADADAVRAALRPPLVEELDDELGVTSALLDGFRGRVRDA
jgi:hypothetical protein